MPWQWIGHIFNKAPSKKQASVSATKVKQGNELNATDGSSLSLTQQSAKELELAFFSWLLNCNNADLQNASKELHDKEQKILKALDQNTLSLDQLPRRPASFPMLIKLLNSEGSSLTDISSTLLADPSLATKTLKTANSPFFKISPEPVDSVERAVFILGSQGIRNIISVTVMMPMLKGKNSKESIFSQKAWEWALLSATASDQYSNMQGHEPGVLYLLGLLPSLAYLVIYQSLLAHQSEHQPLQDIEPALVKSIIQKRSWKVCHDICQQWGLPPASNKYLLDAERPSPTSTFTPLRDGILMGSHKVLQAAGCSPIDDTNAFTLTSAPKEVDTKVAQHIEDRIKAAPTNALQTP